MANSIKLTCRLCEESAIFESTEAVKSSEWGEPSPLGALKENGIRKHRAYCPGHAME